MYVTRCRDSRVEFYTKWFYAIIPTLFPCFLLICYLSTLKICTGWNYVLLYAILCFYPYTSSYILNVLIWSSWTYQV